MRITELATEACKYFTTTKRESSGEMIVVTRDDRPEWLADLIREVHDTMMPDDWRYATIGAALEFISDADPDDRDEWSTEFADANVDIYTNARFAWLESGGRAGYVDDAVAEMGHSDQGLVGDIGLGQYAESAEVFDRVRRGLEARLEEIDDEEEGL